MDGFPSWQPGFDPRPLNVGFVVDIVTLELGFLKQFSLLRQFAFYQPNELSIITPLSVLYCVDNTETLTDPGKGIRVCRRLIRRRSCGCYCCSCCSCCHLMFHLGRVSLTTANI